MLEIYQRLGTHCHEAIDATITLTHDERDKGRLLTNSENGEEVRLFLERGKPLQVGEYLKAQCGRHVRVEGAVEAIVHADCLDWHTFARACYHLGNRHVKLQVGERWLRIQPDHVLEDMLLGLGLSVHHQQAIFLPESGAYAHGHSHH